MKTLFISVFVLLGLFLFKGDIILSSSESQADPDVKITVNYTSGTQIHVVPLSQVETKTDQIHNAPGSASITTCSYEFSGTNDCSTGSHPSCDEALEEFKDCVCNKPQTYNPPDGWC